MGIIFALISATMQAVSYIFVKRGFKTLSSAEGFFFQAIWGLVIWGPLTLYLGVNIDQLAWVLVFGLLSALLSEAFVYYVLSKGEISITGTIFSTYSVYTVLFSMIINAEQLSAMQFVYIGVTIVGTLVLSLPKNYRINLRRDGMLVVWPVLGAISVGFADSLSKGVMDASSFETFLFSVALAQLPVSYAYLRLQGYRLRTTIRKVKSHFGEYKFFIIGTFVNVISVMFLWLSFSVAFASIMSPIQASYPFILVILAGIFLNEKITRLKLLGVLITVSGVIGLAVV